MSSAIPSRSDSRPAAWTALICVVRGIRCALPLQSVVETMRPLPVEPIASTLGFVMGASVIRGAPVPVVDLGAVLGSEVPPQPGRFVTLSIEGRSVALAVEAVLGVHPLPDETLRELPPLLRDASTGAIARIGTLDASIVAVLHSARILPEEFWKELSKGRGST